MTDIILALATAAIITDQVTVVTFLAHLPVPIATKLAEAFFGAAIAVLEVSIIALLIGIFDAVSTDGENAIGAAVIGNVGIFVAGIAFFSGINDLVSTNIRQGEDEFPLADRGAAVPRDFVAVVAFLIGILNAVPAVRKRTVLATGIGNIGIVGTVVAFLSGFRNPVATAHSWKGGERGRTPFCLHFAGEGATVSIAAVAVIASFVRIFDSVSAAGRLAGGAAMVG